MTTPSQIEIEKEFTQKLTIHKNLGQEVILTTVDKVTLCLMKNRDNITAKREWLTPLSIFLALLTTLVAADFRKFIFEPNVWTAIYVIGAIVSFVWLCRAAYSAWLARSTGTITSIVNELKAQAAQPATELVTN
ncbi:MAG: hypothetical protein HBSIN02_25380 [Bacteroidia bacterium]|nr:MAG: hypothetical protein HBSIN02_25380 [Bacteroidia bacterium]